MTNQDIIEAVSKWQKSVFIHPLTCCNNSSHKSLIPIELNGKVILKCLDCNYVQETIPEPVILYYKKDFLEKTKKFRKNV